MSEAALLAVPRPVSRRALLILTALSALLTAASFPPLDMGPLAWVALVPLLLALGQATPRQGLGYGLLYGVLFMGIVAHFVAKYGVAPWAVSTAFMALFYGLFGLGAALICRGARPPQRVLGLAGLWTLLELARAHAHPGEFTFGALAYSQHAELPVIQFASIAGHYGVSFLLVLLNAALSTVLLAMLPRFWGRPGDVRTFNRLAGRMALVSYGAMFLVYAWGGLLMKTGRGLEAVRVQQGPTLSVVVAQANLVIPERVRPEDVVRSGEVYDRLSRLNGAARLIVWPETALPTIFPNDMTRWQLAQQVAARERAYLVTGACESEGTRLYNSAFLFGPDGACRGSYRKQDLVVFGEYVPMRKQWKFLRRYPLRSKDFTPGAARRVFPVDQWQIAPLICYEGTFPEPAMEATRLGADIIVLITSDLWAVGTAEPAANSIAAPFRAIEARRYLVRAASNGLTAVYDPYGAALGQVDYMQEGVARAQIPPVERRLSTYHRYGNAPLLGLCALFVLLGLLRPRSRDEG